MVLILTAIGFFGAGIIFGGNISSQQWKKKIADDESRRNKLPDDELFREAFNEVADLVGDKKIGKTLPIQNVVPKEKVKLVNGCDVDIFYGQRWKIPGIEELVKIHSLNDGYVKYTYGDLICTVSASSLKRSGKLLIEED